MKNFLQDFEMHTWWSVTKPVKTSNGINSFTYPETHFPTLSGTSEIFTVQMEATTLVSAAAVTAIALLMQ